MLKKSQVSYTVNVSVKEIDKITHKVYNEVKGSNRATRNALYGIIKFLNGEFNPSINDYINSVNKFIPRFIALGKGSSIVRVNDTSLDEEYLVDGNPCRIRINDSEVVNNKNNPYMKLITKTYISDDMYDNQTFTELGLFSTETSQSCWARVVMDKSFKKLDTTVLEVTWEISVISPSGEDDYKMDYIKLIDRNETETTEVSLEVETKSNLVDTTDYSYLYLTNIDVPTDSHFKIYPVVSGDEQDPIEITSHLIKGTVVNVSGYDGVKFYISEEESSGETYSFKYKLIEEYAEEDVVSYSLYIDGTRNSEGITNNEIIYTKHDYTGAPIGTPHTFTIDIDNETGELKINDVTIISEY